MTQHDYKLFSLDSNPDLAGRIANCLGVKLGEIAVSHFSDGEININIEESIRGDNIYIIQSTSQPVNENLMQLMIMIDACRRASANEINVVIPYFGYARQDRKAKPREPITAKLVANMIQMAGATRVLAIDLHASQIQGFFDIPVDHLLGAPLIANYFLENEYYKDNDNVVVISPDHGGVKRTRKLAEFLNKPIAIIDKRRPKANVAEVMNIIGNVEGKDCIIIDDMIDTAGTIAAAAEALMEAGAKSVAASCTHAVLSGPAVERLEKAPLREVILTDTIKMPKEKRIDKMRFISVAELMAEAIKRIQANESVSPLFQKKFNATKASRLP